jgi:hypothetical protein
LTASEACDEPFPQAVILLDNSGADAVLGIIPLARELARRGATVVLAANSLPALNDITDVELKQVMELAAQVDPVLKVSEEVNTLRRATFLPQLFSPSRASKDCVCMICSEGNVNPMAHSPGKGTACYQKLRDDSVSAATVRFVERIAWERNCAAEKHVRRVL